MKKHPRVLVVMSSQGRPVLMECLQACGAETLAASCCQEAYQVLDAHSAVDLVFAPLRLQDGSWRQIIIDAMHKGHSPQAVVCMDQSDGGWVDILEQGAMGLLVKPFSRDKVQNLLARAVRARGRGARPEGGS